MLYLKGTKVFACFRHLHFHLGNWFANRFISQAGTTDNLTCSGGQNYKL